MIYADAHMKIQVNGSIESVSACSEVESERKHKALKITQCGPQWASG